MTPTEQMLNFKSHVAWYTRNMCANCPKHTNGEPCAEHADCRAMACNALVLEEFYTMISRLKNQPAPALPTEYHETVSELKNQVAELKKEIQDLKNVFPEFQEYRKKHFFEMPLSEAEFSVRTHNCLHRLGIRYVGELTRKTEADLLRCRNFGRKCLNEVKERLREANIPSVLNGEIVLIDK